MKGSRPLTDREVSLVGKSFAGTFAKRNKALFTVGYRTGFRISELLSLVVGDVMQHGKILDQVSVQRCNMKGGKGKKSVSGRTVPLHPEARAALSVWLENLAKILKGPLDPATPVFCSRVRDKLTGLRRHISREQGWRILKEAFNSNELEGKLGTHAMRKTFANRMFKLLKGDLVKTQHAMGHANINSTVSYMSFNEEDITDAILAA
jgi:site-specific recombinase XerD